MIGGARRSRLLWAVYVAAATAVCLVIAFPGRELAAYASARLRAGLPGLEVRLAAVRPAFPPGVALEGLQFAAGDRPLAFVERLEVRPEWSSLSGSRTAWRFTARAGAGTLEGRAQTPAAPSGTFEGIRLEEIPALRNVAFGRVAGRLDGRFGPTEAGGLGVSLRLADGRLEPAAPLFRQERFLFPSGTAELTWQAGLLLVRNARVRGNEVDLEISGSIRLGPAAGEGTVDLSGRILPHAGFVSRAGDDLPAALLRRRGGIPFRVSGPLSAPEISLSGGGGGSGT
ncbi:MAG: type II secretion system protein GspN [Desulfobacterales bacterium]